MSLLDALLDRPLEQILRQMPLSAELELALLTGSGDIGELLRCVSAYEVGELDALKSVGVDLGVMWELYLEALKWADVARHSMIGA